MGQQVKNETYYTFLLNIVLERDILLSLNWGIRVGLPAFQGATTSTEG